MNGAKVEGFRFLRARYLLEQPRFGRCQEIPPEHFCTNPRVPIFLSHQWETPSDPDPSSYQLRLARHLIRRVLARKFVKVPEALSWLGGDRVIEWDDIGVFYDYACMPQSPRTDDEQLEFERTLERMHELVSGVPLLVLPSASYLDRSWCSFEAHVSFLSSTAVWILDYHLPLFDRLARLVRLRNAVVEQLCSPELRAYLRTVDEWTDADPGARPAELAAVAADGVALALVLFPLVFGRIGRFDDRHAYRDLDADTLRDAATRLRTHRAIDGGKRVTESQWAKFFGCVLWSRMTCNPEFDDLFDNIFRDFETTTALYEHERVAIRNQLLVRLMDLLFEETFLDQGYVYLDSPADAQAFPRHSAQYSAAEFDALADLIDREFGGEFNVFRRDAVPAFYRVYERDRT